MGFKQLLTKVQQAEEALEMRERLVVRDWRSLKQTWRDTWTPGRVVVAGLAAGFVVGLARPVQVAARSGQVMQLVTMLSGLFAGGSAKIAAEEAGEAAETAQDVAEAVAPGASAAVHGAAPVAPGTPVGS